MYLNQIARNTRAVLDLAGFGDVVPKGLHVPGGGGAAFGAEAAVEADVFVFDHDASGLSGLFDRSLLSQLLEIGALFVVGHVHYVATYLVADVTHHLHAIKAFLWFLYWILHKSKTSVGVLISSIG